MKTIAYLLFAIGITVAITGAAKLPIAEATFPDTWWVFAIGTTTGLAGVVLWRMQDLAAAKSRTESRSVREGQPNRSTAEPLELLRDVIQPARELEAEILSLSAQQIEQRVDDLLERYILPFAEVRRGIINRFGMSVGAEVLVTVTVAERMLNRTWSAAADGHLMEARQCYPEVVQALQQAWRLVQTRGSGLDLELKGK